MNVDFFKEKFQSKTNSELEEIVKNNIKYVIECRIAALSLMKDRGYQSKIIKDINLELEALEKIEKLAIEDKKHQDEKIAKELKKIKINTTKKLQLENGNQLQIERLSHKIFQIRLEHYQSSLSPVVICVINHKGYNKYYPFFYLQTVLITSVISLCLFVYIYVQNEGFIDDDAIFICLTMILVPLGFQLIMTPSMYPFILNTFKEEFEK